MNSAILQIPGDPYELCPNKRLHFMVKAKRVKYWRKLGEMHARSWCHDDCPLPPPCVLRFVVVRKRTCDLDAIQPGQLALKGLVDGLVDGGLLVGDHAAVLEYESTELKVDPTSEPFVSVFIRTKECRDGR